MMNPSTPLAGHGDQPSSFAQAAQALERMLSLDPQDARSWAQLGQLHLRQENPAAAIECLTRSLTIEPLRADVQTNLGAALLDKGDIAGARTHCLRALDLDHTYAGAHVTLGNVSVMEGHFEEALACFRAAIAFDPACPAARPNIGAALYSLGRHAEALAAFEEALRFEPSNPLAQHMAAALRGAQAMATPRAYIKELFDNYAATFDQHLVNGLAYRTPELIANLVRDVRQIAPRSLDVLDLGCGTGLAGLAIRPWARSLAGVDLAPKMLEAAAARGIYERLECSDLVAVLAQEPTASFDLVLAADVLVYFGALEELVTDVRRVLRPGGLFAFSVEQLEARHQQGLASEHPSYAVNETGRFAHSLEYLRRLGTTTHFALDRQVECSLRTEQGHPIAGWIAAWSTLPQA